MKKKTAFLAALLALCLCINLPALAQAAQAAVPAPITAQEAVERYNAGEDCLFVDKRDYESGEPVSSGRLVYEDGCIQVPGLET